MPGDVAPQEYNWQEQFGSLDPADGFVALDVGKVRGLAIALLEAHEALKCVADIPLEDFLKRKPEDCLMGWNRHKLFVRDVLKARELIR
jgi:hypothetical protein